MGPSGLIAVVGNMFETAIVTLATSGIEPVSDFVAFGELILCTLQLLPMILRPEIQGLATSSGDSSFRNVVAAAQLLLLPRDWWAEGSISGSSTIAVALTGVILLMYAAVAKPKRWYGAGILQPLSAALTGWLYMPALHALWSALDCNPRVQTKPYDSGQGYPYTMPNQAGNWSDSSFECKREGHLILAAVAVFCAVFLTAWSIGVALVAQDYRLPTPATPLLGNAYRLDGTSGSGATGQSGGDGDGGSRGSAGAAGGVFYSDSANGMETSKSGRSGLIDAGGFAPVNGGALNDEGYGGSIHKAGGAGGKTADFPYRGAGGIRGFGGSTLLGSSDNGHRRGYGAGNGGGSGGGGDKEGSAWGGMRLNRGSSGRAASGTGRGTARLLSASSGRVLALMQLSKSCLLLGLTFSAYLTPAVIIAGNIIAAAVAFYSFLAFCPFHTRATNATVTAMLALWLWTGVACGISDVVARGPWYIQRQESIVAWALVSPLVLGFGWTCTYQMVRWYASSKRTPRLWPPCLAVDAHARAILTAPTLTYAEAIKGAQAVYLRAMSDMRISTPLLNLLFANFVGRMRGNTLAERLHLHLASNQLNCPFDVRLQVALRMQAADAADRANGGLRAAVARRLDFEEAHINALKADSYARDNVTMLWRLLSDTRPGADKVAAAAIQLDMSTSQALMAYRLVLTASPTSLAAHRALGSFLMEVVNDPRQASIHLQTADALEESAGRQRQYAAQAPLVVFGSALERSIDVEGSEEVAVIQCSPEASPLVYAANLHAMRLTGYSALQMAGRPLSSLFPPGLDDAVAAVFSRGFAAGGLGQLEAPRGAFVLHRGGWLVPVVLQVVVIARGFTILMIPRPAQEKFFFFTVTAPRAAFAAAATGGWAATAGQNAGGSMSSRAQASNSGSGGHGGGGNVIMYATEVAKAILSFDRTGAGATGAGKQASAFAAAQVAKRAVTLPLLALDSSSYALFGLTRDALSLGRVAVDQFIPGIRQAVIEAAVKAVRSSAFERGSNLGSLGGQEGGIMPSAQVPRQLNINTIGGRAGAKNADGANNASSNASNAHGVGGASTAGNSHHHHSTVVDMDGGIGTSILDGGNVAAAGVGGRSAIGGGHRGERERDINLHPGGASSVWSGGQSVKFSVLDDVSVTGYKTTVDVISTDAETGASVTTRVRLRLQEVSVNGSAPFWVGAWTSLPTAGAAGYGGAAGGDPASMHRRDLNAPMQQTAAAVERGRTTAGTAYQQQQQQQGMRSPGGRLMSRSQPPLAGTAPSPTYGAGGRGAIGGGSLSPPLQPSGLAILRSPSSGAAGATIRGRSTAASSSSSSSSAVVRSPVSGLTITSLPPGALTSSSSAAPAAWPADARRRPSAQSDAVAGASGLAAPADSVTTVVTPIESLRVNTPSVQQQGQTASISTGNTVLTAGSRGSSVVNGKTRGSSEPPGGGSGRNSRLGMSAQLANTDTGGMVDGPVQQVNGYGIPHYQQQHQSDGAPAPLHFNNNNSHHPYSHQQHHHHQQQRLQQRTTSFRDFPAPGAEANNIRRSSGAYNQQHGTTDRHDTEPETPFAGTHSHPNNNVPGGRASGKMSASHSNSKSRSSRTATDILRRHIDVRRSHMDSRLKRLLWSFGILGLMCMTANLVAMFLVRLGAENMMAAFDKMHEVSALSLLVSSIVSTAHGLAVASAGGSAWPLIDPSTHAFRASLRSACESDAGCVAALNATGNTAALHALAAIDAGASASTTSSAAYTSVPLEASWEVVWTSLSPSGRWVATLNSTAEALGLTASAIRRTEDVLLNKWVGPGVRANTQLGLVSSLASTSADIEVATFGTPASPWSGETSVPLIEALSRVASAAEAVVLVAQSLSGGVDLSAASTGGTSGSAYATCNVTASSFFTSTSTSTFATITSSSTSSSASPSTRASVDLFSDPGLQYIVANGPALLGALETAAETERDASIEAKRLCEQTLVIVFFSVATLVDVLLLGSLVPLVLRFAAAKRSVFACLEALSPMQIRDLELGAGRGQARVAAMLEAELQGTIGGENGDDDDGSSDDDDGDDDEPVVIVKDSHNAAETDNEGSSGASDGEDELNSAVDTGGDETDFLTGKRGAKQSAVNGRRVSLEPAFPRSPLASTVATPLDGGRTPAAKPFEKDSRSGGGKLDDGKQQQSSRKGAATNSKQQQPQQRGDKTGNNTVRSGSSPAGPLASLGRLDSGAGSLTLDPAALAGSTIIAGDALSPGRIPALPVRQHRVVERSLRTSFLELAKASLPNLVMLLYFFALFVWVRTELSGVINDAPASAALAFHRVTLFGQYGMLVRLGAMTPVPSQASYIGSLTSNGVSASDASRLWTAHASAINASVHAARDIAATLMTDNAHLLYGSADYGIAQESADAIAPGLKSDMTQRALFLSDGCTAYEQLYTSSDGGAWMTWRTGLADGSSSVDPPMPTAGTQLISSIPGASEQGGWAAAGLLPQSISSKSATTAQSSSSSSASSTSGSSSTTLASMCRTWGGGVVSRGLLFALQSHVQVGNTLLQSQSDALARLATGTAGSNCTMSGDFSAGLLIAAVGMDGGSALVAADAPASLIADAISIDESDGSSASASSCACAQAIGSMMGAPTSDGSAVASALTASSSASAGAASSSSSSKAYAASLRAFTRLDNAFLRHGLWFSATAVTAPVYAQLNTLRYNILATALSASALLAVIFTVMLLPALSSVNGDLFRIRALLLLLPHEVLKANAAVREGITAVADEIRIQAASVGDGTSASTASGMHGSTSGSIASMAGGHGGRGFMLGSMTSGRSSAVGGSLLQLHLMRSTHSLQGLLTGRR